MRPPINSEKHIVQFPLDSVGSSALKQLTIAESVNVPASTVSECRVGAVIKAVYVEFWVNSDDAALASALATFEKVPGNSTSITYAQGNILHDYPNKKNIFEAHQGNVPPNVQQGIPLFRGWIKIPKGKQRMGLDDKLVVNFSGIGNGLNFCGLAIYKEYF